MVLWDDLLQGLPPKRTVGYIIRTIEGKGPSHWVLFQVSFAKLLETKKYVTELLNLGNICTSKSPYGAPHFFVKQKDRIGGVIEIRLLNRIIKRNSARISRTHEMFDRLRKAKILSNLDLNSGFCQIRVNNKDTMKRLFRTECRRPEFLVMPIWSWIAPAAFQTLMSFIFNGMIDNYVAFYIKDLLVYSVSIEDHQNHLQIVLSWLTDCELYVEKTRYEIFTSQTEFLGL